MRTRKALRRSRAAYLRHDRHERPQRPSPKERNPERPALRRARGVTGESAGLSVTAGPLDTEASAYSCGRVLGPQRDIGDEDGHGDQRLQIGVEKYGSVWRFRVASLGAPQKTSQRSGLAPFPS